MQKGWKFQGKISENRVFLGIFGLFRLFPSCNSWEGVLNRGRIAGYTVDVPCFRYFDEKGTVLMAKAAATKKAPSKSEVFANIAEATGLSRKQVAAVFDALKAQIGTSLGKKGAGQFVLPDLCKIMAVHKPAQKPRPVRNPATGEMMMSKAKPASTVVKVRALKKLKEMV